MSKRYECPECSAVVTLDLGGGGISNFRTAYCSGRDDDPHAAMKMERDDDE